MSEKVYVAVIRQRGQLTIPKEIVDKKPWLSSGSVVLITALKNKIIIEPYSSKTPVKD